MPIKTVILNSDLGNTLYVDDSKKVNVNIDNKTIIVKDGALTVLQQSTNTGTLKLDIVPAQRWYEPGEAQQFTFNVTNTSNETLPIVTGSVALSVTSAYAEQVLQATAVGQPTPPATGKFLYSEADNEGVNYTFTVSDLQPNQTVSFQLQTSAEQGVVQATLHTQVTSGSDQIQNYATSRIHVPVANRG